MANFIPQGIIKIGRVPFDNSYRHTVDVFSDRSEQASYFAQRCNKNLDKYTYMRPQSAIRVEGNAEEYYTYNYVMFQNANYGTKWFYAFITDIVYMNENATMLVIELDVLQTWWFDWTLKECFVEREHVNDDTVGTHTNPEPEMPFNLTSNGRYTNDEMFDKYIIVQANAKPHYSGGTEPDGSDAVAGGLYQRAYSGCKYYAYEIDPAKGDDNPINVFLRDINKAGAGDSITGLFMYPKELTPSVGSDNGVRSDTVPSKRERQVTMPNMVDNYVPRNKKLLTYPYSFARFTDNNGGCIDLKYELWEKGDDGNFNYVYWSAIDPSAKCVVAPLNYAGVPVNYENSLSFPITAQCSWPYSSYQNWLAQNALGNALTVASNLAMIAIPAARGLSASAKAFNVGLQSDRAMRFNAALQGRKAVTPSNSAMLSASFEHGFSQVGAAGAASAGFGAWGLANFAADVSRQSMVPDVTRGQCSGNTMSQLNLQTYNVDQMSVTKEYALILDGFFDMYGYQVDTVKKPNLKGRTSWNYVKCQNSANIGNVPATDMAKINYILDKGLTIWHTSDVGNYSLDNSIV